MNLPYSPNLLLQAMAENNMNQMEFSNEIGKSQAQLSKYIAGKTKIPHDVFIHSMNILRRHNIRELTIEEILYEVMTLDGESHREIREALMKMIIAYKKMPRPSKPLA